MSDPFASPNVFFSHDHHACDRLWTKVEAAVDAGELDGVPELFRHYEQAMLRHFAMEEDVLFPAIAAAAGEASSIMLQIMKGEHDQMRTVLEQMAALVQQGKLEDLLDTGDTLLMLIQQHNVKEEGGVYSAADQLLADQWPAMSDRLRTFAV